MAAPTSPSTQIDMPAGPKGFDLTFMSNYLEDFLGMSDADSILATEIGVRLPNQRCRFAKLSNFNVSNDNNFTTDAMSANFSYLDTHTEIYWGFRGKVIAQLFAAQSTEIFPVSNLNQITVQSRPGQSRRIWFAWWW